jgi:hypothetical protein
MKYLKRFNESLEDYNEIVEELKDMLIPLRQDNPDYLYDVNWFTYRNSELLSIDARIWKNGNFFTEENLEEIKPVIKQMASYINSTEEFDHITLLLNYWDEEGDEDTSYFEYSESGYDSLITDFYDTIVSVKLKFVK